MYEYNYQSHLGSEKVIHSSHNDSNCVLFQVNLNDVFIVANCPGISRIVPNFLPVSRKGPENLL